MGVTVNPFANQVSVTSTPVNITVSAPGGVATGFVNPMTTAGDFIVGSTGGSPARLGIGLPKYVLTSNGTTALWATVFRNPMTAVGDIIIGGTAGAPARLPIGPNGTVPTSNGTTITWVAPSSGVTSAVLPPVPSGTTLAHIAGAYANNVSVGVGVATTNRLYFVPFILPRACTITELGAQVTTTGSGNFAAGIYSDSSGSPSALLVTTAKLSTSSIGFISSAVSYTLAAGTPYWAAMVVDNTTAKFIGLQGIASGLYATTTGVSMSYTYFDDLGTWSALPSTVTLGSANVAGVSAIPGVYFNG